MRLYDPRNGIVFHKIFGSYKEICINFLNSLLSFGDEQRIVSIEFVSYDDLPEIPYKRDLLLGARCSNVKGQDFLVEIHMFWAYDFIKHMLLQTVKSHQGHSVSNEDDVPRQESKMPIYALCLLNDSMQDAILVANGCDVDPLLSYTISKEIIIGNILFKLVELSWFNNNNNNCSNFYPNRLSRLWLRFLTFVSDGRDILVPEELHSDPIVSSATRILEQMHLTDSEVYAYERYWDGVSYERSLLSGRFAEGMANAKEKAQRSKKKLAGEMKKDGVGVPTIHKYTGLSIEEIELL